MDDAESPTIGGSLTVQVLSGFPPLSRATEIYREMLGRAGMDDAPQAELPEEGLARRSSFHVVVDAHGMVLGALLARVGSLRELILADTIDVEVRLSSPICECPTLAIHPAGADLGVTELLYRSVYCDARRQGALSLVTSLDTLTTELFSQDYGITFRPLGPLSDRFGGDLVPVGEDLVVIEKEIRRRKPEFFAFLTEPFTDVERRRFDL